MKKNITIPLKVIASICMISLALTQASCTQANTSESTAQVTEQAASQFQVTYVDATGAKALLTAKPDTVVLDIRTPKETIKGYIEGAIFVDFYDDDFSQQLTKLDRKASYIVHCGSGGRSTKALTTLEELGFTNVTHMDGGIQGWNKANLPLTKP